jgi:hypothetical protein
MHPRFHVTKRQNEAVDQVRRAERKEAPEMAHTCQLQAVKGAWSIDLFRMQLREVAGRTRVESRQPRQTRQLAHPGSPSYTDSRYPKILCIPSV